MPITRRAGGSHGRVPVSFKGVAGVANRAALTAQFKRRFQQVPVAGVRPFQVVPTVSGLDARALDFVAEAIQGPARGAAARPAVTLKEGVGRVYLAVLAHEYQGAEAEYQRQRAAASGAQVAAVDRTWNTLLQGYVQAARQNGLANASPALLGRFSRALATHRAANAAVTGALAAAPEVPVVRLAPAVTIIPDVATAEDAVPEAVQAPSNWCNVDIEDEYTRTWTKSFAVKATITYPCIKCNGPWYNPCRLKWCSKTITVLSGSVTFSINIGYDIGCCGGAVWGSATAKACGSAFGASICAGCTATVTGSVGLGKVSGGSGCTYGIGVTATFSCKLNGYTVFSGSFGTPLHVAGPCPPANKICP